MGKEVGLIFNDRMAAIPEMSGAVELVRAHPEMANQAIEAYRQMIKLVAGLSEADWEGVRETNMLYRYEKLKGKDTVGEIFEDGENIFVRKLGRERMGELIGFLDSEFGETDESVNGVNRLCEMMEKAHAKKMADPQWVPKDGDPESDGIVWGQTTINDDQSKIHLAVGHALSQIIFQKFKPKEGEWAKDDLLSLPDLMTWVAVKYPTQLTTELRELVHTWYLSKPESLGWISEVRVNSTKKVYEELRVDKD